MHSRIPRGVLAISASLIMILGQTALAGSVAATSGPDLSIAKTLIGPMTVGPPATYQIVVTNIGTSPAPGPITVTDTIPIELVSLSLVGSGWSCSTVGQNATCTTPGPLAATTSLPPIALTVQLTGSGGIVPSSVTNCADVSGKEDVNPQNNHSCVTTDVVKPGTLCVAKFNDLDGDGVQDPGEPFLAGWTFTVTDASGAVVATLTSSADGRVCRDLPPGVYTVTETLQAGWTQTAPVPVGPQTVTVTAGVTTTIIFGNRKTCCLTFVFQHGKRDNFSLSNGATAEPVVPAPAPPTTTQLYFDGTAVNRRFSDRLTLPSGNCISAATFEIRMKPLKDVPGNDSIMLRIPGTGGATWSKSINSLSMATAPVYPWNPGRPAKTFIWNMAAMPLGSASLLLALDALRVLDVYVQDDTSVDYIKLTVTFCPCQATTLPATLSPAAILSPSPTAPTAAATCDCLPASTRR